MPSIEKSTTGMKPTVPRCPWPTFDDPLYLRYHDKEWGMPVHDDRRIFEFITLEIFQAGPVRQFPNKPPRPFDHIAEMCAYPGNA